MIHGIIMANGTNIVNREKQSVIVSYLTFGQDICNPQKGFSGRHALIPISRYVILYPVYITGRKLADLC